MHSAGLDRQSGFSLVEMLVAIMIFGVMSTFAYRALTTMLTTRDRTGEEFRRWRDIARAVAWMERDFEAIAARPVRDASNRLTAPLIGGVAVASLDEAAITFTRSGDLDESGYVSTPMRVAYRVRDGALERLTWMGIDQSPRSTATVTPMLSGVVALGLRYRNAAQQWQPTWPGTPSMTNGSNAASAHGAGTDPIDAVLPAAVAITIQFANGEKIDKLVPLPSGIKR